mgnify:FL=1
MTSKAFRAVIVMGGVLNAMNVSVIFAEEDPQKPSENTQKEGLGLKVDDLPKPVPDIMKSIQRIGNEVGDGISKATSEGAKAIKKAVSSDPTEQKEK